jgi:hypothetical protein
MRSFKSEVALIKHEVLKQIARLLFDDKLEDEVNRLPRVWKEGLYRPGAMRGVRQVQQGM